MRKGFTLIELLIVVSIIGILTVALLPNLGGAQSRARDASRLAAAKEGVAAAETYYIDNTNYPASGCIDVALAGYYKKEPVAAVEDDEITADTCATAEGVTQPYFHKFSDGYAIMVPLENAGDKATVNYDQVKGLDDGDSTSLIVTDVDSPANSFAIIK